MTTMEVEYSPDADYYALLGVDDLCDADEIVSAYRGISIHITGSKPIEMRNEARQYIANLEEAFVTLKNPASRRAYDASKVVYFGKRYHGKAGRGTDFHQYLKSFQTKLFRREAERRSKLEFKAICCETSVDEKKVDVEEDLVPDPVKPVVRELHLQREAVKVDYEVWEERQSENRSAEIKARLLQKAAIQAKHSVELEVLEQGQKRQLKALVNTCKQEMKEMIQRQKKEARRLLETQVATSQSRKRKRKRVRAQYEAWCQQADGKIQNVIRTGKEPSVSDYKKARPSFCQS